MPVKRHKRWAIGLGPAICAALIGTLPAAGQDERASAEDQADRQPDHLVVLRLSARVLNALMNKEIDHIAPVRDVILGTSVSGMARVVGHPRVQLEPSSHQARFSMIVTGTVYSQTVGRNGPAIVHGHSITRFTASKQVVFEPGKGFYSLPPNVTAQSECFTDDVQTTRGGLVGKIIERKTARQVAGRQSELSAIAQDRAARRIAAAFERHVDEQLTRLNRAVELRAQLANFAEPASDLRVVCCTTPHYVEIASGTFHPAAPIRLPMLAAASEISAPIEVWIHQSLVPENIGAAAKTLFTNPEESAVLHAMALLPGTIGQEAAAAISALVSENKVAVQNVGDWMVVELNLQPLGNVLAVRTLRR